MEVGTKVILYTTIMRGSTQTSYVGQIIAINDHGLTIEGSTGKMFFPWSAIERITF
ncbi:MAG: hypothetical protein SFU56_08395 [Capsulimonadales bacterium]|nr:hypothetical protein [Capsulimonadales bacterium]